MFSCNFRFRLLAIQPIDEYRDIPVSPCNTNNDFLEVVRE